MRILFTGATGVLGRETVPRLISNGTDVTALARSDEDAKWLEGLGARPVSVDLFDRRAVAEAMAGIDTVVHFATSIPALREMRKREAWRMNDRLRSEATRNLVDAAISEGASRFIQQSVTFFYAEGGDEWLDETASISPTWDVLDSAIEAEAHVERFTQTRGHGVVLRLARLYGPGRASRDQVEALQRRGLPIVGDGQNYVSSIHTRDAATAVVAGLTAPPGVYNVVDDDPARSAELTEAMAGAVGAKPPRRVPVWLARLAAGKSVSLLITSQRVSNRKLKDATGWAPSHPSAIEGWYEMARSKQPLR